MLTKIPTLMGEHSWKFKRVVPQTKR